MTPRYSVVVSKNESKNPNRRRGCASDVIVYDDVEDNSDMDISEMLRVRESVLETLFPLGRDILPSPSSYIINRRELAANS